MLVLIQIILLEIFRCLNFKPVVIIGGRTGRIEDPSGKKSEKILFDDQAVLYNVDKIKGHVTKLIPKVQIINNAGWLKKMTLIEFLHLVGKGFNVSYLLNEENIASWTDTGLPIMYWIFMYFITSIWFLSIIKKLWLYSSNWRKWSIGNITSGTDCIRKEVGDENLLVV